MVSCGLDGCVRVWDVRQEDQPVASFEPLKGSQVSLCIPITLGPGPHTPSTCAGMCNQLLLLFFTPMATQRC